MTLPTSTAARYATDTLDEVGVPNAAAWGQRLFQHHGYALDTMSRVRVLHAAWALARSPMRGLSDDRDVAWTITPSPKGLPEITVELRDADGGAALSFPISMPFTANALTGAFYREGALRGHAMVRLINGMHPAAQDRMFQDLAETCRAAQASLEVARACERHPSLGSFLRQEARRGDRSGVEAALDLGADPWIADASRNTGLHHAASAGHASVVELLVARGAHVDQTNALGQTALHLAALGGHAMTCVALLGSGANGQARDHQGRTPMDLAQPRERTQEVEREARGL